MKIENLHIGTKKEIEQMCSDGYREWCNCSLAEQINQIESASNKMGIIFMRKNKGPIQVDRWYVHFREDLES